MSEKVAVLTPVYNDRESFAQLCQEIAAADLGAEVEMFVVDDASVTDEPGLAELESARLTGHIIRLKRNVGHQVALAVGLLHVSSRDDFSHVIVMDCDGEDRPGDIQHLLSTLKREGTDIAVAARKRRSESLLFRCGYVAYKFVFRMLTGQVIGFGNFMVLSQRALKRLANMEETWTHVAGAVIKSKLPRSEVKLDRGKRYAGMSKMNYVSLVLHGIRAVTVFGDAVLTRMALVCAFSVCFSFTAFLTTATMKYFELTTPGWVTSVTGFSVLVALQAGVLTFIALILNGIGFRAPHCLEADARSLVESVETRDRVSPEIERPLLVEGTK